MEPPKPDSAGMALVWKLLQDMADAGHHAQAPTYENGWGVAIKALIVVMALGVLALFILSGAIVYIFRQWQASQNAGIAALSSSKDKAKQELLQILRTELGISRAANLADSAKIGAILEKHGDAINLIILDLALIGQKTKMHIKSTPTKETKEPPQEGG
jgi:hypothetical protein